MFGRLFRSKSEKASKKKGKEISLIVGNRGGEQSFVAKLPKRLLVEHSAVFKKMADNGEFKKSREIKLEEITPTALKKIVEYLGNDYVFFYNHYEAIETLKAAYIYEIEVMLNICTDFLLTTIDCGNVCEIYELASNFSFHSLEYHCLKFIDLNTEDILKSPAFLTIKKATVMDIVKRNSLNINEVLIFRAIITWGLNDCLKRGADADRTDDILDSVKPLLEKLKFLTMTKEELADPEVDKFYKLLYSDDSANKRNSLLSSERKSRSSTVDSFSLHPRKHETEYVHNLDMNDLDVHAVKNGESFFLKIEILKGRLFLTAITLAFDNFVNSKNTACLYVTISATNVQTSMQKCSRGTFLNTAETAELKFPDPLVAKESEVVEITLNVKRAENICPMLLKNDIQIAMPDTKDVAMKITPTIMTGENDRSLFKSVKYFF